MRKQTVMNAACKHASIALLATCASLSSLTPVSAQAQSRAAVLRADQIIVQGSQRIEAETVRSYLQVEEGGTVTAGQINRGLKRLFATGLFQDIRIAPQSNGALLVSVVENPVINQISFEGNRAIEDEILQAQIRSRSRGAFTVARAEADAQTILDAYRAAGRYSATVEPKIIERDRNRVDLVFEITEGDEVGVSAINFVGNSEYSDRRLRGVVETSESAWWKFLSGSSNYDPDRLEFDKELLRRFYFERGYADFEVLSAVAELSPERDGFFITFTVNEGAEYRNGEITVVSDVPGVDAALFEPLVATDSGDVYDAGLVERTVRKMLDEAGREGINFVSVRPEANKHNNGEGQPLIDITYRIVEAPRVYVERIEIEGNSRTLEHVIRREFKLAEGDAFNAYHLQQSRDNIRALGYFSKVDVKTKRGSTPDRVVVSTEVEEQSTGGIVFGVGFSTADSIGGELSITERNFLGRGQFVRFSASVTADRQYFDLRFTEPYFLDRNLRAGFDLFHTEVDNQDESSYDTRRTGFRPRVGFPIDEYSKVDFNYLIQQDEIRGVSRTASPLIQADEGSRIVSALSFDYEYDQRNSRTEPTEGFIVRFGSDFAGLGGDSYYIKAEGSVKGYKSFFREEVVASLELAGGAMVSFNDDGVKVSDRFFLGGDSFRGFENSGIGPRDTNRLRINGAADSVTSLDDAIGGNYYAVTRADVSFPIGLPEEYGVYGGLFMDAGALWGLDDKSYRGFDATTGAARDYSVDDSLDLRVSAGASIFWSSPFGPIRLNFAKPLIKNDSDKTEFFRFTAGTRF